MTDRIPDPGHSVRVDPPARYRNHGEEIAAALEADRADCDCPPGWRHEPTCVHVTGPRLRMLEPLDEEETR